MKELKEDKVNVVLTGGHAATTAIAIVQEIKSQGLNWKLYWIGSKNAIEGRKMATLESEALPRLGVKFLPLVAGRVQRRFTFWTIPSILKTPIGFVGALYYLLKLRPRVVLSFGGFASFPVVVIAKILRIPVVIHEQTAAIGRANLFAQKYASTVAVSRPGSAKYYAGSKVVTIGNPVMQEIAKIKIKPKLGNPPVIFITGGSRGSQSINSAVKEVLRRLLSKYRIIHQTGGLDYLEFSDLKQKLPQALKDNYEVFARVNPLDVADIYEKSDLIVARAGANTVSEILTIKRPAILIPLPISYLDEQAKNAKFAENWGLAKIILQKDLTSEGLIKAIETMIKNHGAIINKIKLLVSPDKDAPKKLVKILGSYIN